MKVSDVEQAANISTCEKRIFTERGAALMPAASKNLAGYVSPCMVKPDLDQQFLDVAEVLANTTDTFINI